jgi:hypothetical protein
MRGVMAELHDEAALVAAARELRARGVTRIEAYTPYRVDAFDDAIGTPRSRLSVAAALGALGGGSAGYALEWLFAAYLYPIDSGGRPPHMPLAFVPIGIEMAFLGAGLTVFAMLLWRAGLVRLWHPVCDVPGFESATRDGFWIAVDARDPNFAAARDVLGALVGGVREIGGAS